MRKRLSRAGLLAGALALAVLATSAQPATSYPTCPNNGDPCDSPGSGFLCHNPYTGEDGSCICTANWTLDCF